MLSIDKIYRTLMESMVKNFIPTKVATTDLVDSTNLTEKVTTQGSKWSLRVTKKLSATPLLRLVQSQLLSMPQTHRSNFIKTVFTTNQDVAPKTSIMGI